jgi:hypothetical protein
MVHLGVTAPSLATARRDVSGVGTQTSALAFGGTAPPITAATEEFNDETSTLNYKTITTS